MNENERKDRLEEVINFDNGLHGGSRNDYRYQRNTSIL